MFGTVDEVTENTQWNYTMPPSSAHLLQLLVRTFPSEEYSLLLLLCHGLCVHLCGCMHPYSAWEVYWMTDLTVFVVFLR